MQRRQFLRVLGAGVSAFAVPRSVWAAPNLQQDFFIFVHAAGGWDVTLWSDPRTERKGLIEPASSQNTETGPIRRWKNAPLEGHTQTFEPIVPPGSSMRLGPALGDLLDLSDRLTIVNGIAMNTVSHADGTTYSATGRHRAGNTTLASSIDVVMANELGLGQLMPVVSVNFPSSFVGHSLDARAIPLRVATVDTISKSLARVDTFLKESDRAAIDETLAAEADALAGTAGAATTYRQLALQQHALPGLMQPKLVEGLTARKLQAAYPQFKYGVRDGHAAYGAAFAVEGFRRDLLRCASYAVGGLDTHNANYRDHARTLQDLFDSLAALVKVLDVTPHPSLTGTMLSERTHIVVMSEFCRTPQINMLGGRDHYPNNSALVISPRFRGGRTFGATDVEQLLPTAYKSLADGTRALSPPDVLATFFGAFSIDPRKYLRDGEIVRELLR